MSIAIPGLTSLPHNKLKYVAKDTSGVLENICTINLMLVLIKDENVSL